MFKLPPPIPKFPVQFNQLSPREEGIIDPIGGNSDVVTWPEEEGITGEENVAQVDKTTITTTESKWILKTDREEYITALENKLSKLSKQIVSSHSSKGDSGYGSTTMNPNFPRQSTSQNKIMDEFWEAEEGVGEGEAERGGYGSGMETEEDTRAGEGLLWKTSTSTKRRDSDVGSEDESNASGISIQYYDSPSISPSQLVVIPPTPKSLAPDVLDRLPYRVPSAPSNSDPARRISFNASVRISGGIRASSSSHHNHQHHQQQYSSSQFPTPTLAITQDLFSPTKSKSELHIRSRSTSPSNRTPLSLSASSSYRSPSTLQNYPSVANLRSTSGPSSIQSRSSSPCSSIYAPLQPPSNTCPSPAFIKTLPNSNNNNNKPKKTLTFSEYLLGQSYSSSNSKSKSNFQDLTTEESYRGYRKVIAQQARRKQEEKKSIRDGLLWWERMMEMLGSASGSRKGSSGVGVGVGAGVAASTAGSSSSSSIVGVEVGGSRDYGTMENQIEENNLGGTRGRKKTRGRSVSRTSSMLSVSSAGGPQSELEDEVEEEGIDNEYESEPIIITRIDKTEADFMFGIAPKRWFRIDWILWKFNRIWIWLAEILEKGFKFIFKRKKREGEVGEQVYQRV